LLEVGTLGSSSTPVVGGVTERRAKMLFSQAVCDECGAGFASGVVVAERRGDPVSYRRSAGPCPRCGGRGRIPGWIFRFHAAAAAARDQASWAENCDVLAAVERLAGRPVDAPARAALALQLTGAWRGVAIMIGRIPIEECGAALQLLGRMLQDVPEDDDVRASAAPGIPGAARTPMSA
jgi:hypothetical protein